MTPWAPRLRAWSQSLLDLVYPPHCVVCESGGAWLCSDCLASCKLLPAPWCQHCGRPVDAPGLCAACRTRPSSLSGLRSAGYYVTPLREAIQALKYEGVRVLAAPLSGLLLSCWQQNDVAADVVVPVPLHRSRQRFRGYNQASLLARALAPLIGLPLVADCLQRSRDTRSQVGLNAQQRRVNVRDAFRCADSTLRGARVLLIDDVFTTGATLEACAQALLGGGARSVWALTLARAGAPPRRHLLVSNETADRYA